MNEELFVRVRAVIADQTGCRLSGILPTSDILIDLGVDGADAEDLLLQLGKEFGFKLDEVRFDRHFGPEIGLNPFALLTRTWWEWRRKRIPVRVADLVEAAETKKWPIEYEGK